MFVEISRNSALKKQIKTLHSFLEQQQYDTEALQYDVFADVYKEDKDKDPEKSKIIHVGNNIAINVSSDGDYKNKYRDTTNAKNTFSNIANHIKNERLLSSIKRYISDVQSMRISAFICFLL